MKLEVTCKTYIDIPVSFPDCWNSDTIMEYKEDLYAEMSNAAMEQIWRNPMSSISEDCQIINVKPYEEGIDEYNKAVSDWEEHYNNRPEDLKVDIKYDPKVTYTPIRRHDNVTNSDYTLYVTNCTKVVSPIYHNELENCRKEIQLALNELIGTQYNELTRTFIKVKVQNIIDMYICEQKIPDFITENDFIISINNEQYEYH